MYLGRENSAEDFGMENWLDFAWRDLRYWMRHGNRMIPRATRTYLLTPRQDISMPGYLLSFRACWNWISVPLLLLCLLTKSIGCPRGLWHLGSGIVISLVVRVYTTKSEDVGLFVITLAVISLIPWWRMFSQFRPISFAVLLVWGRLNNSEFKDLLVLVFISRQRDFETLVCCHLPTYFELPSLDKLSLN